MSDREEIIDLIRNEYDPRPNLGRGDYPAFDWDDGAERIADAILVDRALSLRKAAARIEALENALREYETEQCEGWCKNSPPRQMFDCSGCRARAALAEEQDK